MPLGASLGVVTLRGRMFITLRYRHALFDAAAATDFLTGLKECLLTRERRPRPAKAPSPPGDLNPQPTDYKPALS